MSLQLRFRYNQLSVKGTLPTLANNLSINHFKDYSTSEIIYYMMRTAGTDACQKILDTPVLQNIRQSQKKYDLIITHIFGSDCMVGFTEIFNASLVSLVTSINLPWANDRIGSTDNPSYIPNYFSWSSSNMNFKERIENTILLFKCKFL
jgi:glucuronosyltransferase